MNCLVVFTGGLPSAGILMEGMRTDSMSKWHEIKEYVLTEIQRKGLTPGAALPSDHDIARACGCSVQPVLRALRDLASNGIVERRPGAATTVKSLQPVVDARGYSFSATAAYHGKDVRTKELEKSFRLPNPGTRQEVERRAQSSLGLGRTEPFYVITRLRLLDGEPRVIHRAYLNPKWFPKDFLARHDFSTEGLVEIYSGYGLAPTSRDTSLKAKLAEEDDQQWLGIGALPVLDVEQELHAWPTGSPTPVVIEFLHAVFVDWVYRIEDRQPERLDKIAQPG